MDFNPESVAILAPATATTAVATVAMAVAMDMVVTTVARAAMVAVADTVHVGSPVITNSSQISPSASAPAQCGGLSFLRSTANPH